jgi:hypothetical protein
VSLKNRSYPGTESVGGWFGRPIYKAAHMRQTAEFRWGGVIAAGVNDSIEPRYRM